MLVLSSFHGPYNISDQYLRRPANVHSQSQLYIESSYEAFIIIIITIIIVVIIIVINISYLLTVDKTVKVLYSDKYLHGSKSTRIWCLSFSRKKLSHHATLTDLRPMFYSTVATQLICFANQWTGICMKRLVLHSQELVLYS